MSRRRLRAVVAVTGLGSLACGAAGDLIDQVGDIEVVPRDPLPEGLSLPDSPLPEGTPTWGQGKGALNPRHPEHGTIYVGGGEPAYCYVHVPFDEPPSSWQPPETERVDCPESMHDGAWLGCRNGTLMATEEGEACICVVDGNPPPPPSWAHCPESTG